MKTTNQYKNNRISILFLLIAIILFPFISNAQLYLDASGNVGTGISTPSAKFHIISTTEQQRIGYDASNYFKTTIGSTGATIFQGIGSSSSYTLIGGNQVGSQCKLQSTSANGTAAGIGIMMMVGNNGATQAMNILNNGNIGIGISPSSRLHLISTTEQLRVGYDASNYFKTTVGSTGATTLQGIGSSSSYTLIGGNQVGSQCKLQSTSANGTATGVGITMMVGNNGATQAMNILNNGNVGIGIPLPMAPLDVKGPTTSGSASVLLRNGDQDDGSFGRVQIRFGYGNLDQYQNYIRTRHNSIAGGGPTDNAIDFYTGDGTANGVFPTNAVLGLSINNGKIGIGTLSPTYQLELSTNSAAKPISAVWTIISDKKTKTNVESYVHGLDLVRQVKLVSYEYNGLANTPNGEKGIGVIAQDFQTVFPNSVKPFIVKKDSITKETFLGVDLHELFIANVGAVKQLDSIVLNQNTALKAQIDSLSTVTSKQDSIAKAQNSKIADLQNQISNCCSNIIYEKALINNDASSNSAASNLGSSVTGGTAVTMAALYQNVPNPFNQSTSIQYAIPAATQTASIMVFDLNGKLIKTIPITTFGIAAITINGNELSPGMFVYSLIVDGKIIDTKRMILTQ